MTTQFIHLEIGERFFDPVYECDFIKVSETMASKCGSNPEELFFGPTDEVEPENGDWFDSDAPTPEDDYNMYGRDDMDGDFDSGMASAGYGTDEDYNHYDYNDE
jgi:hypothetical protein